jgi:hypothetical protein
MHPLPPVPARTLSIWTMPAPAPPYRTCGCCSAATAAQRTRQLGALVDGYEQFRDFDRRELALIEPCAPCA